MKPSYDQALEEFNALSEYRQVLVEYRDADTAQLETAHPIIHDSLRDSISYWNELIAKIDLRISDLLVIYPKIGEQI